MANMLESPYRGGIPPLWQGTAANIRSNLTGVPIDPATMQPFQQAPTNALSAPLYRGMDGADAGNVGAADPMAGSPAGHPADFFGALATGGVTGTIESLVESAITGQPPSFGPFGSGNRLAEYLGSTTINGVMPAPIGQGRLPGGTASANAEEGRMMREAEAQALARADAAFSGGGAGGFGNTGTGGFPSGIDPRDF